MDSCWPAARGALFVGPFQVRTPGVIRSCTLVLSGQVGLSLRRPAENYLVDSQSEAWRDLAGNSTNIQTSIILVPFGTNEKSY